MTKISKYLKDLEPKVLEQELTSFANFTIAKMNSFSAEELAAKGLVQGNEGVDKTFVEATSRFGIRITNDPVKGTEMPKVITIGKGNMKESHIKMIFTDKGPVFQRKNKNVNERNAGLSDKSEWKGVPVEGLGNDKGDFSALSSLVKTVCRLSGMKDKKEMISTLETTHSEYRTPPATSASRASASSVVSLENITHVSIV